MKKYSLNLDVIRVLAIIGVVAIHVWYPVYSRPDFLGGISWWLANLINSLSRVAVPWFLMISGALLINRRPKHELQEIVNRLVFRLGLPLVFCAAIYFRWEYLYYGRLIYPDQALRLFLTGSVFHLYFLAILFGLYLLLPVWRRIKISAGLLIFFLGFGFGIYAYQFFIIKTKTIFNLFTIWLPYTGYFLAGSYFSALVAGKKPRWLSGGLWLIGLIITLILSFWNLKCLKLNSLAYWGSGGTDYFTHWLTPNIILMSIAGFHFMSGLQIKLPELIIRVVRSVARSALGIYLIHPLIINFIDKYWGLYLDYGHTRLWWYGSYKFILVFIFSYVLILGCRRLTVIKYLFGK